MPLTKERHCFSVRGHPLHLSPGVTHFFVSLSVYLLISTFSIRGTSLYSAVSNLPRIAESALHFTSLADLFNENLHIYIYKLDYSSMYFRDTTMCMQCIYIHTRTHARSRMHTHTNTHTRIDG